MQALAHEFLLANGAPLELGGARRALENILIIYIYIYISTYIYTHI